jgi:hypothetical protein
MAIAIADAVTAGFGLIRKRPGAVLVWGAVRALYSSCAFALVAPLFLARITEILTRVREGVPPDPATMTGLHNANILLSIVGAFVAAVLSCAVFRAVLRPDDGRLAYLRVGSAELFLFLLTIGVAVSAAVAAFAAAIPLVMITLIAALVHAKAAAVLIAIVGVIGLLALLCWVLLRLSLAGPMMVEDGKFHLADAWALTRGHVVELFMVMAALFIILILIEVVIGAFALAIGIALLGHAAGGLAALHSFFTRPPAEILAAVAPGLILLGLVAIPVFGCLWAIIAAPWARAYRDLAGPSAVS